MDRVSRARERAVALGGKSRTVGLSIGDVTTEALITELETSSGETECLALVDTIYDCGVVHPVQLVWEYSCSTIPTLISFGGVKT